MSELGRHAVEEDVAEARMALPVYRIAAWLIDGLAMLAPAVLLVLVIGQPTVDGETVNMKHRVAVLSSLFLVRSLYEWVCTALWGQTVGKRVCRIQVLRMADGTLPGWGVALVRVVAENAANMLTLLVGPFGGLYQLADFLFILRAPLHQSLHDMAARTVVVDLRPAPSLANF